jgi:hypothetical protein
VKAGPGTVICQCKASSPITPSNSETKENEITKNVEDRQDKALPPPGTITVAVKKEKPRNQEISNCNQSKANEREKAGKQNLRKA